MKDTKISAKHHRRAGLRKLSGLLAELRALRALREGRPGSFEHGSRPFLHFHYHPDGEIIADVRISNSGFTRFDVSAPTGQEDLLSAVRDFVEGRVKKRGRPQP